MDAEENTDAGAAAGASSEESEGFLAEAPDGAPEREKEKGAAEAGGAAGEGDGEGEGAAAVRGVGSTTSLSCSPKNDPAAAFALACCIRCWLSASSSNEGITVRILG